MQGIHKLSSGQFHSITSPIIGFRPKYSCLSSLTIIHEYLINNIEKGEINGLLMLDFSKAFDLVDHIILLQKIGLYGITETSGKWFASYITNRTQQVHLNDHLSSPLIRNPGVPQGSILGLLLFLIYIYLTMCRNLSCTLIQIFLLMTLHF